MELAGYRTAEVELHPAGDGGGDISCRRAETLRDGVTGDCSTVCSQACGGLLQGMINGRLLLRRDVSLRGDVEECIRPVLLR